MSNEKPTYEQLKVKEIREDYLNRVAARRKIEAQWKLNARMADGDQYAETSPTGDIVTQPKNYYWEERTAFNHIAPILDTRLARLSRVRPKLSVRPASSDESDVSAAKVSAKILESACGNLDIDDVISSATMWSELTGTAFYKVTWDNAAGMAVGKTGDSVIREGDVRVDVCPPYEVFPDSPDCGSVADCRSIIHARAVRVADIKRVWGADVDEEENVALDYTSLNMPSFGEKNKNGCAMVIERYTRPGSVYPKGRLEVVAGDKLLYEGDLPFQTGRNGEVDLPFVRQRSLPRAGKFYGTCPIERAIPVQRAYNAVKNRKHEFLNRLASGVLAVEDGSVDVDDLEDGGLAPGKIVVYRAGSVAPSFINPGTIPQDFDKEETRLLEEFAAVSGVSEFMSTSNVPTTVTSGSALELLIEQDDSRLSVSADEIRSAIKEIGKMILRLYRQFGGSARITRCVGESGETEVLAWSASSLACDDIEVDTESEIGDSAAARRNTILELYSAGLLTGADGKIDESTRYKILRAFGFANLEHANGTSELQRARAKKENERLKAGSDAEVKSYDDHSAHIDAHTVFILSGGVDAETEARVAAHIERHKAALREEK
ncbi:MAG: hypothetical protein PUH99_02615 [Firmicutes bacterium]|nr:hypothetical protein [Bacillota bacterium]MDY5531319.1 hypothetical protein [Pumilibacteraceae bacterium]